MTRRALPLFDVSGWSAADLANPYPIYRRYREDDPVHLGATAPTGGLDTWYVFRYGDVAAVLASLHFGRDTGGRTAAMVPDGYDTLRMIVENWLVFMDPPRHTRLRSVINKKFIPKVVADLRPRVERIAAELVGQMRGSPVADLVEEFAAPFPILVISELLGVSGDSRDWFREKAMDLREGIASRKGRRSDGYALAEKAARDLVAYFQEEIRRRRFRTHKDMMAVLVEAQRDGEPLTDEELIGTSIHLLIAGHETTTNLISKSVLVMLAHPEVADTLRSDPFLLPTAVNEFVRYDPPVQMVTRWAQRDEVVGTRQVRAGDKIVLVLGSANRDPLRFANPDALLIHGRRTRHCGFGAGIHSCLGAPLARLETEIGLKLLLKTFWMQLTDDPVPYGEDIVFHGPTRLMVRTGH
ncbi:MAG: cytochrome P450 [Pseudonocardiaceae bacterium]